MQDYKQARRAWENLHAKRGLQYGGSGDLGMLDPFLRKGSLALDAGCGDGKTTEALSRKCEVVACDFSREALMKLRTQREKDYDANLVQCNIISIPFHHKMFDILVCVHTLSHMLEKERITAAAELARVLKPSGYLFVEGFGRGDIRYGEGTEIEEATFLRGSGISTHYFSDGEIAALFPYLELVSEVSVVRRVSFGARAGKRDTIRALLKKPG